MAGAMDFAGMVPGFDFLQNLMKGAGAGLPSMGQWVAPTLDPAELEKRISELRTVQFWLEQNGKLLGTTIQAMEVQRMTLATLQTMNLPMADLRESLLARVPAPPPPAPPPPAAPPPPVAAAPGPAPAPEPAPAPPAVDPMKWWGALTEQFAQIASQALQPAEGGRAESATARTAGTPTPTRSAAAKKPAPRRAAAKPAVKRKARPAGG